MGPFLLRRLLFVFISLIGATATVFSLSRAAGDPVLLYAKPAGYGSTEEYLDNLRKHLGTDKPLIVQYVRWVGQYLRGDMGRTLLAEQPVARVIQEKIGNTFQLAFVGWLISTVVGVPIGVLSAVKRGSVWDYIGRGFALFGQSVPPFAVGILGILIFAVHLDWLPAAFKGEGWGQWKHFVLPSITVAWASAAGYLRITRSSMLEVLDSEFVKWLIISLIILLVIPYIIPGLDKYKVFSLFDKTNGDKTNGECLDFLISIVTSRNPGLNFDDDFTGSLSTAILGLEQIQIS